MTQQPPTRAKDFASVYIERVTIQDFRGISECTLELEPDLTLLVGRNNVGKSRILSAIQIALGGRPADVDDFTMGSVEEPKIDIVMAPLPPESEMHEDTFDDDVVRKFASVSQTVREEPFRERVAWRTRIRRSAEGGGARSESVFLNYDVNTGAWIEQANPFILSREHRQTFAVDLVGTGRDLMEELGRRGSGIRRVLSDLEIEDEVREEIESQLTALGKKILDGSSTLESISLALARLDSQIGSMGSPDLNPLPVRVEELARSISIELNSGHGSMPIRLHGAGSRSLASLQVQGVLYDRRLGHDGPSLRPHPVSLIEEPEAHLHPQATLELAGLLRDLRGQKIVSTHSAILVTAVDPKCIRLLPGGFPASPIVDLGPADTDAVATHRSFRPSSYHVEMEKLRRLVERPLGELLFANVLILGDGASERAFLPVVLRHALKAKSHGICVLDPQSMNSPEAQAAIKFANMISMPWFLFADSDGPGREAVDSIVKNYAQGDMSRVVWASGLDEDGNPLEGAFEQMLVKFDETMCREVCVDLGRRVDESASTLKVMKGLKGSGGSRFASALITKYPSHDDWPASLRRLIAVLEREL